MSYTHIHLLNLHKELMSEENTNDKRGSYFFKLMKRCHVESDKDY